MTTDDWATTALKMRAVGARRNRIPLWRSKVRGEDQICIEMPPEPTFGQARKNTLEPGFKW